MATMFQYQERVRKNFGKIPSIVDIPNLIEIQRKSYETFLQRNIPPEKREDIGLQSVFKSVFPIADYNGNASLEFIGYHFGEPKYSVEECHKRGMTFAIPLKVNLRLVLYEVNKDTKAKSIKNIREEGQEVYLGELPLMTDKGTFIINGTERVVVSQLQRSPGVFFDDDKGKTLASGRPLYSARIIPYRGSWVEFDFDANDILYVRIDRRRKMLTTAFLRAFWFVENNEILTDETILSFFYDAEVVSKGKDKRLYKKLDPVIHAGEKISFDINDPKTGETILQSGKRLTSKIIKRMELVNINTFPVKIEDLIDRRFLSKVIDARTGEVIAEPNQKITPAIATLIMEKDVGEFKLLSENPAKNGPFVYEILDKDNYHNPDEALVEIYRRLRPGDPPTVESARALFKSMFLDPRRYDLARVGRFMLDKKLGMDAPLNIRTLRGEDIVKVIQHLLLVKAGQRSVDDIDHLGNRRVRSVGELLENQFRVGLMRMERAVKERMSIASDLENVLPHDLINAKPVSSVVKEFFGSSQLSQFMDQTNPLAELTHKRRLSALGPRGLSRERAGFEVRDVHPTHYGRVCPIETPEGPNIGLISSLSTYARINEFGFIETPYRKVNDGIVTEEIVFLSALDEEQYVIAQANAEIDDKGRFLRDRVSARKGGEFITVTPDKVDFMDVSPKQLVSVAASLIPFLENDDANRALMGSNMQRQAVPLLNPEAPIVGTGMESVVARDSGAVVLGKRAGVVESVTADRIMIRAENNGNPDYGFTQNLPLDVYSLIKFQRSNQNTCINQRAIVKKGDKVKAGQVIADGPATNRGELALGQNVLVAFMPWGGYNFEDAILISEKLVKDDRFTSIHIEEFEIQARDTKPGREEITRDIPNVSEEALKNLDESGIIRIGAKVKPGDILVGKITPKGETQLTPEEKLLRAIFGEKAGDVRDTSLMVPPGIEGTVVDVKVFSRRGIDKDERAKSIEEEEVNKLEKDTRDEISIVENERNNKIKSLYIGKVLRNDLIHSMTKKKIAKKGDRLTEIRLQDFSRNDLNKIKVSDQHEIENKIRHIEEQSEEQIHLLNMILNEKINRLRRGDDLPPGVIKMVKVYIAVKRKISVGDKMAGRHGNKGVVSKILPEEDMPYLPDGTPVEIVLNPLGVPSRMNVGQILETHLGWAAKALGLWIASPVFDGATEYEIKEHLEKALYPTTGKTVLYDGRTGKPFHQEVTVGYLYMMKLAHLVDDKMHARSIGPYSLVTQQPLGGKAQFGGQRFGEMEVWALEAYGAANTLQEMLTVKSDDVYGRNRIYEAIVKGENFLEPGIPESFNVLVKELQSLGLDVELLKSDKN